MSDVYERFVGLLGGFGVEPAEVQGTDTFSDLDLDSLALVEISLALQGEFGIDVDDDELVADNTVDEAVKVIESKMVAV
ncbi:MULTISPECIES: acyl carrier protein [unclassified Streptomyces]|uniref:acyl carrier protein n=1 Tax=unclassified Streptomyces TaxID=2593676 RepID=UPI00278BDCE4|nr:MULTISPECIES: acyl carrier protein [unclassified Streptomyces]